MKKISLLLIFILSLVGCKPEVILETTGGITGKVTEAGTNTPLANASINISGVGQMFTTGEDGNYTFRNLPEGEYSVTASKPGYSTEKKQFVVRAGSMNNGDFSLKQEYAGLELSTYTLDFGMEFDKLTFDILKQEGSAKLDWKIEKQSNVPWLSFSDASGSLTAPRVTITVYIDRSQITKDEVSTDVIVKSRAGGAKTLRITILKKGAMIVAEPQSLDFGPAEVEKSFLIKNVNNDGAITFKTESTESWCTIINGEGTIVKDAVATVKVKVSRVNLAPATYSGNIVVRSSRNTLTIPISMTVLAKSAPEVNNLQSIEVKHNSVHLSAYISSIGSSAITNYGFCWSQTNATPTTSDSKNSLGGTISTKSYESNVTGLTPNTIYYVRAYAVNDEGVGYSNPIQIKTLSQPTRPVVRTLQRGQVLHNSVEMNGSIDDLGDGYVTSYGFCYSSTNITPTISDQVNDLGSTTEAGAYKSTITNLTAETIYYIRAFAKNSVGIAYGEVINVTTKTTPPLVMNGLLAYYTFDERNCDDFMGEVNYHGMLQGSGNQISFVLDTPGGKGYALRNSNGGEYYRVPTAPEKAQNMLTYSVWVKTKATSTDWYYTSPGDIWDPIIIYLGLRNSKVSPKYSTNSRSFFDTDVRNILCNNNWHHLAITVTDNSTSLYLDGRFIEKKNMGLMFNRTKSYQFSSLGMGDGIIDNLRIYNRILSTEEIKKLYEAKQ